MIRDITDAVFIGRKLESAFDTPCLNLGIIIDVFHFAGYIPVCMEVVKIPSSSTPSEINGLSFMRLLSLLIFPLTIKLFISVEKTLLLRSLQ